MSRIDRIWDNFKAGRITADQMIKRQNRFMPRCATCAEHGRKAAPAIAYWQDKPICTECARSVFGGKQ